MVHICGPLILESISKNSDFESVLYDIYGINFDNGSVKPFRIYLEMKFMTFYFDL